MRVRSKIAGVWGTYGATCVLTTPAAKQFATSTVSFKDEAQFRVFPNPTEGAVRVHLAGFDGATSLQLMDVTGRVLQQWNNCAMGTQQLRLNLPAGAYYLVAQSADAVQTSRVVVQ